MKQKKNNRKETHVRIFATDKNKLFSYMKRNNIKSTSRALNRLLRGK
jgi:hypothetical protein